MPARELPSHPDLAFYKKEAKDLLDACKAGDARALARLELRHRDRPVLAEAQFVIAREHGFASWATFAAHIRHLRHGTDATQVFAEAQRAVVAGDVRQLERLLRDYESLFKTSDAPSFATYGPIPDYRPLDARRIIAAEHHFTTFAEFEAFAGALADRESLVARFERAADAVVSGNPDVLGRLLESDPSLVRARSARTHHATLLHYVGSNGVEGWRQRAPQNIVQIAQMLLDAGADVNAVADMYRGSTTIGLAATSIHPWRKGVLQPLLQLLIERGAAFDVPDAGSSNGIVQACLANGRSAGAELMARHGAPLNLESAAGVGRLDLVKKYFDDAGRLTNSATPEQMKDGFTWACEFGRRDVVEFLLDRGMDIGARLRHHGQTGLHWAAGGAHVETVGLLISRGAVLDAKDESFGATPLLWALYGWSHPSPGTTPGRYCETVSLLVRAGAPIDPQWLQDPRVRADPRMQDALTGPSTPSTRADRGIDRGGGGGTPLPRR
jgi:ankyrin repeat protein